MSQTETTQARNDAEIERADPDMGVPNNAMATMASLICKTPESRRARDSGLMLPSALGALCVGSEDLLSRMTLCV